MRHHVTIGVPDQAFLAWPHESGQVQLTPVGQRVDVNTNAHPETDVGQQLRHGRRR
jgi:hypothetical protein